MAGAGGFLGAQASGTGRGGDTTPPMTDESWPARPRLEDVRRHLEGRHALCLRKWRLLTVACIRLVANAGFWISYL